MDLDRRRLIALTALSGAVPVATLATPTMAAPLATLGVDATTLGVRAGGGAEQTNMLQSAIDQTAGARVPLVLGPGETALGSVLSYRAVVTEPILVSGEEQGGSDADRIVTNARRRPDAKSGPPLRGCPQEPAGEQVAMPPAWLKLSGGQFHLLTVACLRVASATRLRCAPRRRAPAGNHDPRGN